MFIDDEFPFLAELRQHWIAIRGEYLGLPADAMEPWVQREMYGQGWSVYGLVAFGERIEPALRRCPQTASAIARIPNLTTAGFSRLQPGTHIKPHEGWVTTVYRAHLGLIVPPGTSTQCGLRVGAETRRWSEGGVFVFDDTTVHEAWNFADTERVVLLFDFTRPGAEHLPADPLPGEVAKAIRAHGQGDPAARRKR